MTVVTDAVHRPVYVELSATLLLIAPEHGRTILLGNLSALLTEVVDMALDHEWFRSMISCTDVAADILDRRLAAIERGLSRTGLLVLHAFSDGTLLAFATADSPITQP